MHLTTEFCEPPKISAVFGSSRSIPKRHFPLYWYHTKLYTYSPIPIIGESEGTLEKVSVLTGISALGIKKVKV